MLTLHRGKTEDGSVLIDTLVFCIVFLLLIAIMMEAFLILERNSKKTSDVAGSLMEYQNTVTENEIH